MDIIISIVIDKADEFDFKGKTYVVNDSFKKYAKRLFVIYILAIGALTAFAYNIAPYFGVRNFIGLALLVVVFLLIYNFLVDKLVRFLISKKVS